MRGASRKFWHFGYARFVFRRARERYNPVGAQAPHMPDKARAKAFIFVYMAGGPSHLETWDGNPTAAGVARRGKRGKKTEIGCSRLYNQCDQGAKVVTLGKWGFQA